MEKARMRERKAAPQRKRAHRLLRYAGLLVVGVSLMTVSAVAEEKPATAGSAPAESTVAATPMNQPLRDSAAPTGGAADMAAKAASPEHEPATTPPPAAQQTPPLPDGTAVVGRLPDALSPWGMFMQADVVVKAVIIGLALASVATWTVLLVKTIQLRTARRAARGALTAVLAVRSLLDAVRQIEEQRGAVGRLVAVADEEVEKSRGLPAEGIKERVAWQLERVEAAAVQRIGRGMGILATIGAVAPFVGLFGTVWGIMNSFIGISRAHTTNLAVVAPGIAEALLATAFGLAAAIPAVVIYNAFARATGGYRSVLADSSVAILRLLSRDLDRHAMPMEPRRTLRAADAPALSISNPAE